MERTLEYWDSEQDTFSVKFGIWGKLRVGGKNCKSVFNWGLLRMLCILSILWLKVVF